MLSTTFSQLYILRSELMTNVKQTSKFQFWNIYCDQVNAYMAILLGTGVTFVFTWNDYKTLHSRIQDYTEKGTSVREF